MSAPEPRTPEPAPETLAEAAAWIAELHDAARSPYLEGRVRSWVAEDPAHRLAFERMTRAWETSGELGRDVIARADAARRSARWRRMSVAAGVLAVLTAAVLVASAWLRAGVVATGVGEQRSLLLTDGTRVLLNTSTRLIVHYDAQARRVRLLMGEALFDVARRTTWPFIVTAGSHEVRALGTSFIVRHDDPERVSITLVEGRVSVVAARALPTHAPAAAILSPGQRLTVTSGRAPALDTPELGRLTAWETGRVEFDATPLGEAAREMNRYSPRAIEVDPEIATLAVTGVFRAADLDEFVHAVCATFDLTATQESGAIRLSRSISASE